MLNRPWKQYPTNQKLYDHLPPILQTIQIKQTRHAEHCWKKARTNSSVTFSNGFFCPHTELQKLTFIGFVRTLDRCLLELWFSNFLELGLLSISGSKVDPNISKNEMYPKHLWKLHPIFVLNDNILWEGFGTNCEFFVIFLTNLHAIHFAQQD